MRKIIAVFVTSLALLAVLDVCVALTLGWAERNQRLGSLVQYFEYGRSVPGKLDRWKARPDTPRNLYDVAWIPDIIDRSRTAFQSTPEGGDRAIRSYGMSFVNNIMKQAVKQQPTLVWDSHSGPGTPPNFTYTLFEADRPYRREGDVVILGVLASSIPAMAALTSRTWVFEQPAPFTYPVYWPEGDGLRRVTPLVQDLDAQNRLAQDPQAAQAWQQQLKQEDAFYNLRTFAAPWMDASPFVRLVRRSLATSYIEQRKSDLLRAQDYPYAEVLARLIVQFADTARADGQKPVVFLVQTRNPAHPDVLAMTQDVLKAHAIPYLATIDHFDPKNPTGFVADGHYKAKVDALFGAAFLQLLENLD